jgi:hypothetical protein
LRNIEVVPLNKVHPNKNKLLPLDGGGGRLLFRVQREAYERKLIPASPDIS